MWACSGYVNMNNYGLGLYIKTLDCINVGSFGCLVVGVVLVSSGSYLPCYNQVVLHVYCAVSAELYACSYMYIVLLILLSLFIIV